MSSSANSAASLSIPSVIGSIAADPDSPLGARALATRRHSLLRLRPMCPPFCPSMSVPDLWRPSSLRKGPPTFWHQGHVAPFACQEKRGPEPRRAFLLPKYSLIKCIHDWPMHAGVIVMALRRVASRDIKNLQGHESLVRPSLPRVGNRSAWPRNRPPKSPRRRACFPVSSPSFRAPRPLLWRPILARSSCPTWFSKSHETSRSTPTART